MIRQTASFAVFAVLLAMVTAPSAEAGATSWKQDFSFTYDNECTGEVIDFTAQQHFVLKTRKDGTVEMHVNLHGQGVSNLGVDYQFTSIQTLIYQFEDVDNYSTETVTTIKLVGQGPSNNCTIYITRRVGMVGGEPFSEEARVVEPSNG